MKQSDTLSRLKTIASDNGQNLIDELKISFKQCVLSSGNIIDEMNNENFDYNKNQNKINNEIEKLLENLNSYDQLKNDDNAMDSLSKDELEYYKHNMDINYRQLNSYYYKYMIERMNRDTKRLNSTLNSTKRDYDKMVKDFENLNLKIEGLGATFLNMILAISVTTGMIEVLAKIETKYSLAIVLGSAWILLTTIIFIGSYFKRDNKVEKVKIFPIVVYIILTVLTLVAFGIGYFLDGDLTKLLNNKNNEPEKCIKQENVETENNNLFIE